jgi:hypothetical protein
MGRGSLRNVASHSFLPLAGPHIPAQPQQDTPPSQWPLEEEQLPFPPSTSLQGPAPHPCDDLAHKPIPNTTTSAGRAQQVATGALAMEYTDSHSICSVCPQYRPLPLSSWASYLEFLETLLRSTEFPTSGMLRNSLAPK